jgi:5'-3' exonuclease
MEEDMKLGKHTLLIDGNYFIYSRLFVMPRPNSGKLLGDDKSKAQFMRKLCIDFASEIRKMQPFLDKIVLTIDSKSWRKDLFPDAEYKGTRTQDDSVCWDGVYEIYDEFKSVLAKRGVIVHQVNGAEADDLLFGWSTYLNSMGKNCIVWTGDSDLIQIVDYSKATDGYTLWYYNSKKKLIAFEGFNKMMAMPTFDNSNDDDLLFNMASKTALLEKVRADLSDWLKKNRVEVEEVNCDHFIFKKILMGDKSDNIKSVVTFSKEVKGKPRTFSITEKQASKILEQYIKEEQDFTIDHMFVEAQVEKIADIIYRVVGHDPKSHIKMRFNQNLDIMLLHNNTIPESIQQQIQKSIDKDISIDPELSKLTQMEKILESSKWVQIKADVPKQFDPFAGLEDETNSAPLTKNLKELF